MASTEVEQPLKTWVLRVSIHCEGCKRKVKKLLQSLPGVHDIDIETKLQRVVVTGDIISPDIIIRKLVKAGKHAQLWPQNPPQRTRQPPTTSQGTITQQETKSPPTKTEIPVADPSKSTSTREIPGGGKGDEGVSEGEVAGGDGDGHGKKPAVEVKVEDKKPETAGSAGNQASQPVVEQKEEQTKKDSSVVSGGDGKRKKKKKAQNSNKDNTGEASSSASPPIIGGSGNEGGGSPPPPTPPSNQSPPRHHGYQYPPPPHYYRPPAAPVYTVSYNTAHPPVSSYTASYYAAAAPQSYAYSHFQSEMEPPAPAQSYGYSHYRPEMEPQNLRSPLDSFEMFSDENPNGCLVM